MTPKPEVSKPLIPYLRVSRLGGRSGESFISLDEQKRQILRYCGDEIPLTDWYSDPDFSGKNTKRPAFQRGLQAIADGEASGMIVCKLDRFARSVIDALTTAKQIKAWDGRFISTSEGLDIGTPAGALQFTVFAALAEFELARLTESWRATTEDVVMRRGVHVSRYVPFGYVKKEDEPSKGKLLPDLATSHLARELFERRAYGDASERSWTQLTEWLARETGKPLTRTTVQGIIANRVYLGEAHSAGTDDDIPPDRRLSFVNPDAHEPLTDPKTFEDAQQGKGRGGRTGEIADQAICRGFLKCGSCGHTLVVTGAAAKDPESGQPVRRPVYYCSRLYASGECPQPASITAAKIDPFIEDHFLGLLANPVEFFHPPRASRLPELQAKLDFANRERSDLVRKMTLLIEAVGETEFDKQLSEKIAEARALDAEIEQERLQTEVRAGIDTGTLLRDWRDFTRPEKNEAMRLVYESVKVVPTSGNKRGRWAPPAEERVAAIVIRPEL
jgi:site-specific DNA recombinase